MVLIDELDEDDPSELTTEELRQEVERLRKLVEAGDLDDDPSASDGGGLAKFPPNGLGFEDGALPPSRLRTGAPMPPGYADYDTVVEQDKLLKYSDGATFKGEVLGGKLRHGRGVHTCANGDYYDGDWVNDKRHGWGKMAFVRGLQYEGEWSEDKTEGFGVCVYENGDQYSGDWLNDHRWGWGTHTKPSGEVYEGEWVDDIMEGKARVTFPDGAYFEGEFTNGLRVKGKYVSADGGTEYVGRWKNELRDGYGTFHQTGLYKYMGEWKEDQRHGRGKCVYGVGVEYDGEWQYDVHHGFGKWTTHEEKYEGAFLDNARHGQGTCVYASGDCYTGEWVKDARTGYGKMVYGGGDAYEGQWVGGRRDGKGTCTYANGDRYQGEWKLDRRHGYGVCFFADGTKFRGEWEDDCWVQSTADPEFTRVLGPGLARGVAGEDTVFGVEARDEIQNKRLCGGDEFTVRLDGPGGCVVYGHVQDNDDGTYIVRYNATIAGRYQLHVTLGDNEAVAESPYPVRVLPARAFPRRCAVVGDGRRAAVAGSPAEFHVEVKDRFGNLLAGDMLAALPLEVSITLGELRVPTEVTDAGQGRLRVSYTAPRPGFYRLMLQSVGPTATTPVPLGDSPYSLQVRETPLLTATVDDNVQHAPAVEDKVALWEQIAMVEFGADGVHDGWDSEDEVPETKEQRTIRENPDTPVIENYEDLYKLPKLQRMQKEKKEREQQAKLAAMRKRLEVERLAAEATAAAAAAADGVEAAEQPPSSSIADLD